MEEKRECDVWTVHNILNEIVNNVGSLQGIHGVRWLDIPQDELSSRLLLIKPWEGHGEVVRLEIKASFNTSEKEAFDKEFDGS